MRRMVVSMLAVAVAATGLAVVTAAPGLAATGDDVVRTFAPTPADLRPNDVAFDPVSGLVFVASSDADPGYPSALVAFDPADGSVSWSVALGGFTRTLAVAADGSRAYVGVEGDIVEVDLATKMVTATHDLGSGVCGDRFARDLVVLPGDPTSVVVAADGNCHDGEQVLRMTGGIIAADVVSPATPVRNLAVVSDSIVVGADETENCGCHRRLSVDADGVAHLATVGGALDLYGGVAVADGEVFGNRVAVDVTSGAVITTFEPGFSAMTPAIDGDVVYFGNRGGSGSISIDAFDRMSGTRLGASIWTTADIGLEGMVITSAGIVVWGEGRFHGEGVAPPPAMADIDIAVWVDLLGTGYRLIEDLAIEMCIEIWDADREELLVAVETVAGRVSVEVLQDTRVKVLAWDCNRFGLFPTWYEDAVLGAWDEATTLDMSELLGANLSIFMDPFFLDVPFDSYYFGSTVLLRNIGITNGCEKLFYCPDDDVTRAQMAAFIARFWRFFDGSCSTAGSPFGDVAITSFAFFDVGCIADLGITQGTGPGMYSPNDVVTREQMAAFIARLWRAFGRTCPDGDHPFLDVPATSFAAIDIACIFLLGITTGTSPTTYDPSAPVTRAQMAAFLERLFDALVAPT